MSQFQVGMTKNDVLRIVEGKYSSVDTEYYPSYGSIPHPYNFCYVFRNIKSYSYTASLRAGFDSASLKLTYVQLLFEDSLNDFKSGGDRSYFENFNHIDSIWRNELKLGTPYLDSEYTFRQTTKYYRDFNKECAILSMIPKSGWISMAKRPVIGGSFVQDTILPQLMKSSTVSSLLSRIKHGDVHRDTIPFRPAPNSKTIDVYDAYLWGIDGTLELVADKSDSLILLTFLSSMSTYLPFDQLQYIRALCNNTWGGLDMEVKSNVEINFKSKNHGQEISLVYNLGYGYLSLSVLEQPDIFFKRKK
jgi:hypothetical protein